MATARESPIHNGAASDWRWLLVRKIIASEHLRTSPRLCEFLLYICDCAIREAPGELSEQQIGNKVFGRPPGYNTNEDNIVRSHARLLRLKLEAYFASEGSTEEYVIEVPKGHYLPVFRERSPQPPLVEAEQDRPKAERVAESAEECDAVAEAAHTPRALLWALSTVALTVLVAGLIAAAWFSSARSAVAGGALETFWRPFFAGDPALVIYSNAPFVMDKTMGLVQLEPDAKADQPIIDDYTGTGEVAGVLQLARLFDAHRATFILKRGRLVTWDEARTRNLIFVGSTAQNLALRDLPATTEFSFALHSEVPQGLTGIVNHHPKPGEQRLYLRPDRRPIFSDFAIVSMLPGVQPGHRILVLSGMMTYATQAAVEFVCRPDTIAELLRALPLSNGQVPPFEAVLETTVRGGVPLHTRLVAVHVHTEAPASN